MSQENCYHCGLPIPSTVDLTVCIEGQPRVMCCIGCQAVAQAIVDNGLSEYYRHRDALPDSPREALPAILDGLKLYDHVDFQKSFVRQSAEGEREASLIIEGITCAACIWLNEQHVAKLPGVTGFLLPGARAYAGMRRGSSSPTFWRRLSPLAIMPTPTMWRKTRNWRTRSGAAPCGGFLSPVSA